MIHKISKTDFYTEVPAAVADNNAKNKEVLHEAKRRRASGTYP